MALVLAQLVLLLVVAFRVQSDTATSCTDFPMRLPGKILETQDSSDSTPTCPSEDDPLRRDLLAELNAEVDSLVEEQLLTFQQLSFPSECPSGQGWRKVFDFNLEKNNTAECPGGWKKCFDTVEHCRLVGSPCQQHNITVGPAPYWEVCGRVKGYQVGRPTAFHSRPDSSCSLSLSDTYLDGVSITRNSLTEHIWSFAAGSTYSINGNPRLLCPCVGVGGAVQPPPCIGDNFFCNSGTDEDYPELEDTYERPLWVGEGCGDNTCCQRGPYFYRQLDRWGCEDLEVRLCVGNEVLDLVNVGVSVIELYVR